ncbi:hypothetical protein [Burkholderia dolosa]|uniref:hypothetical protein n=1 Tax=Burkholderia dolosa TaxID=152500 RepID=UPI001B913629|nr:hypothetical protein [Burkholderia dolosa]MBR8060843.1 hypothetical protein [Burkholderia dolosa]
MDFGNGNGVSSGSGSGIRIGIGIGSGNGNGNAASDAIPVKRLPTAPPRIHASKRIECERR